MRKPYRYLAAPLPAHGEPAPTGMDLVLKIGTALLISFAATLLLVRAEAYFGP
jgi:hypothetical protein